MEHNAHVDQILSDYRQLTIKIPQAKVSKEVRRQLLYLPNPLPICICPDCSTSYCVRRTALSFEFLLVMFFWSASYLLLWSVELVHSTFGFSEEAG